MEIRAVGIGELLARLERLRRSLAAEGLSRRTEAAAAVPARDGRADLRADSAAERDVLENAARRWPAVSSGSMQVAVQGTHAVADVIEALQGPTPTRMSM